MRASGSVTDYTESVTSELRTNFANSAGVSEEYVNISVAAGSVIITATINVPPDSTATDITTRVTDQLADPKDLSLIHI